MSTSGAISSRDTAGQIILDALQELQIYGSGNTLKAADSAMALRRLSWMLKEWQDDGLNLWRLTSGTVSASASPLTLATRMQDVEEARLALGSPSNYERPLERWEWGKYVSLPNKAQAGAAPTIFVFRNEFDNDTGDVSRLYLWPVPSAAVTINFSGPRVIQDVTDVAQNIDVPQQYTRTVMMNLAAVLAPAFGLANDPNAIVTIREAARLYQIMRANDRPASYFLERA